MKVELGFPPDLIGLGKANLKLFLHDFRSRMY